MRLNENGHVSNVIQTYMNTRLNLGSTGAQMRLYKTRHVRNYIKPINEKASEPGLN